MRLHIPCHSASTGTWPQRWSVRSFRRPGSQAGLDMLAMSGHSRPSPSSPKARPLSRLVATGGDRLSARGQLDRAEQIERDNPRCLDLHRSPPPRWLSTDDYWEGLTFARFRLPVITIRPRKSSQASSPAKANVPATTQAIRSACSGTPSSTTTPKTARGLAPMPRRMPSGTPVTPRLTIYRDRPTGRVLRHPTRPTDLRKQATLCTALHTGLIRVSRIRAP